MSVPDFYDDILSIPSTWSDEHERTVLEPFTYITASPGKEIRARMIDAFNRWLNVPPQTLKVIARIISTLHSASLLVDDIEDDSQLRRGRPVAHKIYGVPQTINCANYAYFLAYQDLFNLRDARTSPAAELDRIVTDELVNLHRGQGLEILWRDSLQCPTEQEYIAMVNNKTGGLFRIAVKLMMACATTNRNVDYVPLVNLFGIFYQIRDDYSNLQSKEYTSNKGFAEDLTEGKFSFPIVHGVRADTSNRQVLNILQKRPTTPTLKHFAINYLTNHTRSFDYTVLVLENLEEQVRREIRRLDGVGGDSKNIGEGVGGNVELERIVDELSVRNLRKESLSE